MTGDLRTPPSRNCPICGSQVPLVAESSGEEEYLLADGRSIAHAGCVAEAIEDQHSDEEGF